MLTQNDFDALEDQLEIARSDRNNALQATANLTAENDSLRKMLAACREERDRAIARADHAEKRRQHESVDAYNGRINAAVRRMSGVEE